MKETGKVQEKREMSIDEGFDEFADSVGKFVSEKFTVIDTVRATYGDGDNVFRLTIETPTEVGNVMVIVSEWQEESIRLSVVGEWEVEETSQERQVLELKGFVREVIDEVFEQFA